LVYLVLAALSASVAAAQDYGATKSLNAGLDAALTAKVN
jgi:hypothetical protein